LGLFPSALGLWRVKNLSAPRVYGISLLIGTWRSIAIELIRAYFPTQDSSLVSIFSNTLGTALGEFIFKYALPIFHKVTIQDKPE
jgi:VanZ family protein